MSVDEAINAARVAIHKYFINAHELPIGAKFEDIKPSRDATIEAIKEFIKTKKEHGEKSLTPYEERSLESFDAAEIMMQSKVGVSEKELYGGGHCGCCQL